MIIANLLRSNPFVYRETERDRHLQRERERVICFDNCSCFEITISLFNESQKETQKETDRQTQTEGERERVPVLIIANLLRL